MTQAPLPPLDTSRIRALIFDIDGTLSDSDDLMVEGLLALSKPFEALTNPKKAARNARNLVHWLEKPGNWMLAMLDRIGLDGILAKVLDWRANLASKGGLQADDFPIISGILPMLDQLSGQYPMAVVSARNGVTTNNFLRANALENYFKAVIHSQSLRRTKPFPDPLLRAAEVLGVEISKCLMIGDTATDVRAALAAGAYSLSVLCGFGRERELREAGTHAVLISTSELADFLLRGKTSLPANNS
jgi:phosphoglycolate phosphatase-like HAD superfamily hydrolase